MGSGNEIAKQSDTYHAVYRTHRILINYTNKYRHVLFITRSVTILINFKTREALMGKKAGMFVPLLKGEIAAFDITWSVQDITPISLYSSQYLLGLDFKE